MNLTRLITYHEIAAHWQVSLRSVRRWVIALENLKLIKRRRPTARTVRLTVADYLTLESRQSQFQCGPQPPSVIRLKSPQKRTGSGQAGILLSLPKCPKTSLTSLVPVGDSHNE